MDVAVAALGSEAVVSGDGFEQSGFSGAVFASEEDDAGVEVDLRDRCNGWDAERINGPVFDSFAQECDLFEHEDLKELLSTYSAPFFGGKLPDFGWQAAGDEVVFGLTDATHPL